MEKELFSVVPKDRQHRNSHLNKGNVFFLLWGRLSTGTGCPEKISILGDIQNLFGCGPGRWLCLDRGIGPFVCQRSSIRYSGIFVKLPEVRENTALTLGVSINNSWSRECPRNAITVDHLWKEPLLHPTYLNELYWREENDDVKIKIRDKANLVFGILHGYFY